MPDFVLLDNCGFKNSPTNWGDTSAKYLFNQINEKYGIGAYEEDVKIKAEVSKSGDFCFEAKRKDGWVLKECQSYDTVDKDQVFSKYIGINGEEFKIAFRHNLSKNGSEEKAIHDYDVYLYKGNKLLTNLTYKNYVRHFAYEDIEEAQLLKWGIYSLTGYEFDILGCVPCLGGQFECAEEIGYPPIMVQGISKYLSKMLDKISKNVK